MEMWEKLDISEAYSRMHNEIAEWMKKLVLAIWNETESTHLTVNAIRTMLAEHEGRMFHKEESHHGDDCYTIMQAMQKIEHQETDFGNVSYFYDFMNAQIFEYSTYNDLDRQFEDSGIDLLEEGFGFSAFYLEFSQMLDKSIKQLAGGRNIEDKIIKSLNIILITEQYKQDNIKLTLRQLYYQLVSKNIIANKEAEYNKLISLTGDMRENSVLELDEFADNTRFAIRYTYEKNPGDFLFKRMNPNSYHRSKREGQAEYLEVWIEKEALRSVVKPITDELDVPLFICRGYPSTSSLFEQAQELQRKRNEDNLQEITILYFGDHDPSGLQIPEAIGNIFTKSYQMPYVNIVPCGLTMQQVIDHRLPPNPAKLTDPRAIGYVRKHGESSWELDALPPKELQNILRETIERFTDVQQQDRVLEQMWKDRDALVKARTHIQTNWGTIVGG